jgi:acyl dehydratase
MTVTADEQERLLRLCGIDPAVFGTCMDPAGFISLAIQEGVKNGISAHGRVNLGNTLIQHRQMRLDEPLTATGEIVDVEKVSRGVVATSETWFSTTDGTRALTSRRRSLNPNPSTVGTAEAGEKPVTVIQDVDHLKALSMFKLRPEDVKAYTGSSNPIHYDPEAARRIGFRSPIIGGGQGVRFITAEIWRRFKPQVLELEIYFRRPIFWDDTVTVMVDECEGNWRAIGLINKGKVATEAKINRIE